MDKFVTKKARLEVDNTASQPPTIIVSSIASSSSGESCSQPKPGQSDMEGGSTSLVCSADVAAFVDALETINYNEVECYESGENVVICISEEQTSPPPQPEEEPEELSVTDIEDACTDTSGGTFFNPETRKLKAVMQRLVAQKKAVIVKKSLVNTKGTKQFKSDVWNWFGDVRLFLTESDAYRLKIPFYIRSEGVMICRSFVGCFRCNALFMYDAQKHSTSTLRYHVRACNRPKECIFVSDDKMDEDPPEGVPLEAPPLEGEQKAPTKRFRTDPRKQKEVIEQLFAKQRAVVTKKSFMNMKGNRRFKSDVWNWFGDIKLLISRSEAKKLKIPYYIRRCGDEQMVLSKVFVGCFKCLALFIHDSQKSTSTLRYHIRTCSRPKERKKRTTPNIIFIPKRGGVNPRAPSGEAIPAHEKLLNFALSTEGSLEVLRDPEFHKVLQMCIAVGAIYGDVNVDSLLCATPTLTSFILNDLYVTSINEFYTEFQHSYGATYRPSVWIDEQVKCPFVSMQCSYATREGDLKSVIVHTDDFDYESKTADGMAEWFSRFLSDQPVIPFKRLVATDSESNLAQAFKDEIVVKCCVQHITNALQAVSSKGAAGGASSELPDFTNFLSNCVDLVEHFDLTQHRLTQDLVKCLDDKWTSIMGLFRSIEGQYEEVLNALNDAGTTHLLSVEKSALTATVDFFRSFEEAIIQLSSATKPTLNLVIPWVIRLQDRCSVCPGDPAALKQFKSCVGLEVANRAVKNVTIYHRMATFLDPRFKKVTLGSAADHLESSVRVKCLVKECMESPCMEDMLDSRASNRGRLDEPQDSGKCEKAALEEVDRYLAEPFHLPGGPHQDVLATVFPVLKWWTEHTETYPNLSRIAMWLLSCPASSALENESFWSNNWLVNCPRYPIPPDNVNKVLFVKTFRGL